ncbi:MAG: signal peptidase I [Clostridia bacterium]|nr:signal peptidase I [Clostridia bacterium]
MKNCFIFIKRLLSVILDFLVILCIIFLLLNLFGVHPFIVQTGSMEPSMPQGSLCFIDTKYNFTYIKNGDVIVYEATDNIWVTHRVIEKDGLYALTKGDANPTDDGFKANVWNFKGKVLFSLPLLNYRACFF